jgi:hypothetical protein
MRNRECIKKASSRLGTYSERNDYAFITYAPEGGTTDLWYFFDDGRWVLVEAAARVSPKVLDRGTWECNGNENFKIFAGNSTYMSDIDDWVEATPEADPNAGTTTDSEDFACILKNKNVREPVATVSSDGNSVSFFVDEPNNVSHIFYKNKKWTQSKEGQIQFTGKWNCDYDHHFYIFTDDESYSSRSDNWGKINRDTFPLKFNSKGPNVVKLQKFLNRKLPNNPLTVDGIFDTNTENKLIQYQREAGIIL